MIPGNSGHIFPETTRFIKEEPRRETPLENFALPGQTQSNTPPSMAGNFRNNYDMNNGRNGGDQNNGFGMYEADSNYRWRKIRGNLDLFVMERNERHLTSLQWKWQKMPRSRRRTPGYEQPQFFNDSDADVYKQMPESARTRSRAESRQRMREELDTYFYERWKNADQRQNADRMDQKHSGDVVGSGGERNPHTAVGRPDYDYFNDSQPPMFGFNPRNNNAAKWSRYGYFPDKSVGQEMPQHVYQPPYVRQPQCNVQMPHRGNVDEYLPRAPYSYNRPNYAPNIQGSPPKFFNGISQKEQNEDYGFYGNENPENYNQQEWNRRQSRYPRHYAQEPTYTNYGYSQDYNYHQHPRQQHNELTQQYAAMHPRQPMPVSYEQSASHADPWLKKDMEPPYSPKRFITPTEKPNSWTGCFDRSEITNITKSVANECISRYHRRPRFVEGREDPEASNEAVRLTISRRQKRNPEDVATVPEEAGDDDVFVSPSMSPQTKDDINRWAEQSITHVWKTAKKDEIPEVAKETFRDEVVGGSTANTKFQYKNENGEVAEDVERAKVCGFNDKQKRSPNYAYNSEISQGGPDLKLGTNFIPTATRLPPLRGNNQSSGNQTPVTPFISPGSSNLSLTKGSRAEVRTRSSTTKRVAFATDISKGLDDLSSPTSPKRERITRTEGSIFEARGNPTSLLKTVSTSSATEMPRGILPEKSSLVKVNIHESQHTQKPFSMAKIQDTKVIDDISDKKDLFVESTTIHVGDIDAKSESIESRLLEEKLEETSFVAPNQCMQVETPNKIPDAQPQDFFENSVQSNAAKNDHDAGEPSVKTKQSLWQLTKLLGQKVGSKLSMKKESSSLSQFTAEAEKHSTPEVASFEKEEKEKHKKDVESTESDKQSPLLLKPDIQQTNDTSKTNAKSEPAIEPIIKTNSGEFPCDPLQVLNLKSQEFKEEPIKVSPTDENNSVDQSKPKEDDDTTQTEKYYEEHPDYHENRRQNEETTSKLLKEQADMEKQLYNLKRLLDEELSQQRDQTTVHEKYEQKISEIEQHIIDLDKKLTETSVKLQENDEKSLTPLQHVQMGEIHNGLPPNPPLFILADPELGTAAAVTQGYSDDMQTQITVPNVNLLPYTNVSYYNESISVPSSFSAYPSTFEETKRQQEELKAELESQMAALKLELEQQLKERNPINENDAEMVIDVRVTNLELQIAEMNHKIGEAEKIIRDAEQEKFRKKMEKESYKDENQQFQEEELKRGEETKTDEVFVRNPEHTIISPFASPQLGKKLRKELSHSFHINSPKVSPGPVRKMSFSDLSTTTPENYLIGDTDKRRIQKLFDTEDESKPGKLKKSEALPAVKKDDDDDDVIILDDISTENITSECGVVEKLEKSKEREPQILPEKSSEIVGVDEAQVVRLFTHAPEVHLEKLSVDCTVDNRLSDSDKCLNTTTETAMESNTFAKEKCNSFENPPEASAGDETSCGKEDFNKKINITIPEKNIELKEKCKTEEVICKDAAEKDKDKDVSSCVVKVSKTPVVDTMPTVSTRTIEPVETIDSCIETTLNKLNRDTPLDKIHEKQKKCHTMKQDPISEDRTVAKKSTSKLPEQSKPSKQIVSTKLTTQPKRAEMSVGARIRSAKSSKNADANTDVDKEINVKKTRKVKEKMEKAKSDKKPLSGRSSSSTLSFLFKFKSTSKTNTGNIIGNEKPTQTKQTSPTKLLVSTKKNETKQKSDASVSKSWWQNKFGKPNQSPNEIKMKKLGSSNKPIRSSPVSGETEIGDRGTPKTVKSLHHKQTEGLSKTPKPSKYKRKPHLETELTVTTIDSDFTQVEETVSAIQEVTTLKDKLINVERHLNEMKNGQRKSGSKQKQQRKRTKQCIRAQKENVYKIAEKLKDIESRNSKLSEWATTSAMSSRAGQGWDGRPESKTSLLYGLGTSWCVCPRQIWKYLGDETDDEPITRRKCISLIMGLILALLLLAIVIGLIIGLATSIEDPTESPIRFVVIPGDGDTDGTNQTDLESP